MLEGQSAGEKTEAFCIGLDRLPVLLVPDVSTSVSCIRLLWPLIPHDRAQKGRMSAVKIKVWAR